MMTKRPEISLYYISIKTNQKDMRRSIVLSIVMCLALTVMAQRVSIVINKKAVRTGFQANNREQYAAEYLQKKLTAMGYSL